MGTRACFSHKRRIEIGRLTSGEAASKTNFSRWVTIENTGTGNGSRKASGTQGSIQATLASNNG